MPEIGYLTFCLGSNVTNNLKGLRRVGVNVSNLNKSQESRDIGFFYRVVLDRKSQEAISGNPNLRELKQWLEKAGVSFVTMEEFQEISTAGAISACKRHIRRKGKTVTERTIESSRGYATEEEVRHGVRRIVEAGADLAEQNKYDLSTDLLRLLTPYAFHDKIRGGVALKLELDALVGGLPSSELINAIQTGRVKFVKSLYQRQGSIAARDDLDSGPDLGNMAVQTGNEELLPIIANQGKYFDYLRAQNLLLKSPEGMEAEASAYDALYGEEHNKYSDYIVSKEELNEKINDNDRIRRMLRTDNRRGVVNADHTVEEISSDSNLLAPFSPGHRSSVGDKVSNMYLEDFGVEMLDVHIGKNAKAKKTIKIPLPAITNSRIWNFMRDITSESTNAESGEARLRQYIEDGGKYSNDARKILKYVKAAEEVAEGNVAQKIKEMQRLGAGIVAEYAWPLGMFGMVGDNSQMVLPPRNTDIISPLLNVVATAVALKLAFPYVKRGVKFLGRSTVRCASSAVGAVASAAYAGYQAIAGAESTDYTGGLTFQEKEGARRAEQNKSHEKVPKNVLHRL